MNRRDFIRFGWATLIATRADVLRPAFAQAPALRQSPRPPTGPCSPLPGTAGAFRLPVMEHEFSVLRLLSAGTPRAISFRTPLDD